jgi:alkyldihydroxyacetonephosphate synthase
VAVTVDDPVLARLDAVCPTEVDPTACAEASRDWWPLAMHWALDGTVPAIASVIARPTDGAQVGEVLAICDDARVPVTAAGGRSGVCGASVPLHGGVVLDLTGLAGVRDVDEASLIVDVGPGTFGDVLEEEMHARGYTVGHWPQSIQLSTVGGWLACRGAGQMSNRYGKIEDIVAGLDVELAGGRHIRTGGHARAAAGPDLTQLFVGSEGTLGVITGARLRLHPAPLEVASAAYGFDSYSAANEACRRMMARGARPAILRTYDPAEAARSFGTDDGAVLLVRDEGDPELVAATMAVVGHECGSADGLDAGLVDKWWDHRNDVSALEALTTRGYVVDTMEVTAPWRAIDRVYEDVRSALRAVEHVAVATAHQSHAYTDGACLYFTFAAQPPADERERTYVAAWDAGTRAALAAGASLSHHHGVGLNRSRFLSEALGPAHAVLVAVKSALDPHGILNPGKLGLPDPFGEVEWP